MRIKSRTNFLSGLLFLTTGLVATSLSLSYDTGTANRMGPGYFPFCLGVLLIGLSLVVLLDSLWTRSPEDDKVRWDFKVLGIVLLSVVLFGLLLNALGLVLVLMLLVITAGFASHEFSWRVSIASAVSLTLLCVVIFVYGLGLPLPLWPTLTGF